MNYKVKNLYNLILQRDPDPEGYALYCNHKPQDIITFLQQSEEYKNLLNSKKDQTHKIDIRNIPYTIVHIDDRALNNINDIKNKLANNFTYVDTINFIDARTIQLEKHLLEKNLKLHWRPTHNPTLTEYRKEPLIGEIGLFLSLIEILEYIVNNDIEEMIVFEDDSVLTSDFLETLSSCYKDLPDDYDFLSDMSYIPIPMNFNSIIDYDLNFLCNSNFICKSSPQVSSTGFMLYSKKGAQKILDLFRTDGFTSPIDLFIYNYSRDGYLNSYTTFYSNRLLYDVLAHGSMIDTNRIRIS